VGDRACAFVRGFQYNDVFYYNRVGFDQELADYSPGTVSLYLMIEDLFNHRPPKRINLAGGDWSYKALFATEHIEEANVLLVRRRLKSRLRLIPFTAFRFSADFVKQALRYRQSRMVESS
jgi:CelD/BcsL family acetyltransferase involved in cellulose biosynthesis